MRDLRKILLAKIHLNKKYKEIKKMEAWEDFLFVRFKKSSCKDLSNKELIALLNELLEISPQDKKIKILQKECNLSFQGLLAFCHRQVGCSLDRATKEQKTKIIIGLLKLKKYKEKK